MYDQVKNLPDRPAEIDLLEEEPETPFQVEHLLDVFFELNSARSGGGFGANPISYQEIQSWSEMRLFPLSFWEVAILKRLDMVYLSYQSKKSKEKAARNKQ